MKVDIISLFPKMFTGPFDESIINRAQKKKLIEIKIHNLRKWTTDKRSTVDDRPYGGGAGMVLMVEPIWRAINALKLKMKSEKLKIILLSPQGKVYNQKIAKKLSKFDHLILVCGHYEGFDERIREFVDEEISIGDYILTGGEIPAMVLVDSVVRLIPNVLKKPEATQFESFSTSNLEPPPDSLRDSKRAGRTSNFLLEHPQYTRPENFQGLKVPKILLSGNHQRINDWRAKKALEKTEKKRPDLLKESEQKK